MNENISKIKIDNDNNTSIDADFLINGNLGGLNELSDKSPIEIPVDMVNSEKSPFVRTVDDGNVDIFNVAKRAEKEDIHVELQRRPATGHIAGRPLVKHHRKRRQPASTVGSR